MAQTKTKASKKTKSSSKTKSRKASKPRSANSSGSNGAGRPKAAREAVGSVTSKAKVPLLASGAALVGAAGGAVLSSKANGRKVMGVRMPQGKRVKIRSKDFRKVAKDVGSFGEQVGELTGELRRIRKGMSKA